MHLLYLFPELYLQLLRGYRALQRADGEVPFILGARGDPGLLYPGYFWQVSLNGTTYISMIDRLWVTKGDDAAFEEFYDSIKACHLFMSKLSAKGWLSIADRIIIRWE